MGFLQLAILIIYIFIGTYLSGIGLRIIGMIGLLTLLFGFGLKPSDSSIDVMLIALSAAIAAGALQAAVGMGYLVHIAEKYYDTILVY